MGMKIIQVFVCLPISALVLRMESDSNTELENLPDFVLVWKVSTSQSEQLSFDEDSPEVKRQIFVKNLEEVGIIVEPVENDLAGVLKFVKLYARTTKQLAETGQNHPSRGRRSSPNISPRETPGGKSGQPEQEQDILRRYAEILKIRMPMKKVPHQPDDAAMTAVYSRDKEYLFDMDESIIFNSTLRARVIGFILSRTRYSEDEENQIAFGIERLIKDNVYLAAYPLHEVKTLAKLKKDWASLSRLFQRQPLDEIKEYYGVKVALYFAWLGYYTRMLVPAAIVGVICFLYGCITVASDTLSNEICSASISVMRPMCPLCDKSCDYWDISRNCFYSKLTYLFDNGATVFFAFFMSLWSAVFMEFWKRHSANIAHAWDLTSFDVRQENPRPEYIVSAHQRRHSEFRTNRITNLDEPYIPFWTRTLPYTALSVAVSICLICIPALVVFAVVVYRISVHVALAMRSQKSPGVNSWSNIIVNNSAAVMNLIFIVIFNRLYGYLALKLTEMENPRTQTAFDNSLTLKMYVVQFINLYSSIIYVAFIKGKFVGTPGEYNTVFGFRQEECGPIGCMTELCIQLAIIMVGRQVFGGIQEMAMPYIKKWWRKKKSKVGQIPPGQPRWVDDYYLATWGAQSLFPEYLEMVLQYGFVTLFVAAFPLAPLFALVNNILEVRLDATKFLKQFKRPVAQRVKDIGTWTGILTWISHVAILTNALIIALTSNVIPKLVYQYDFGSLDGFLNHSLAHFNTSHPAYVRETKPTNSIFEDENVTFCRYLSYVRHSGHHYANLSEAFVRDTFYWRVWLARLIFVILFQNIVTACVEFLKWIIPDVPKEVSERIKREHYWTTETIILYETKRARARALLRNAPFRLINQSRRPSRTNQDQETTVSDSQ